MKTYRKPTIFVLEIEVEDIIATSDPEIMMTNATSRSANINGTDYGNGGDGLVKSQTVDFSSDDDWGF